MNASTKTVDRNTPHTKQRKGEKTMKLADLKNAALEMPKENESLFCDQVDKEA